MRNDFFWKTVYGAILYLKKGRPEMLRDGNIVVG